MKDKSIRPVIAIVIAVLALCLAFCFPYFIFMYENSKLDGYGIHYKAKPVNIKLTNVSITDKLESVPEILNGDYLVQINNESDKADNYKVNLTSDEAYSAAVESFVKVFAPLLYSEDYDENVVRTRIDDSLVVSSDPYLLIKPESKEMFLTWDVRYSNDSISFDMLIDDETGKMLSANIEMYLGNEKGRYSPMNANNLGVNLESYYGFELRDVISENDSEFSKKNYLRFKSNQDASKELTLPLFETYNNNSVVEISFNETIVRQDIIDNGFNEGPDDSFQETDKPENPGDKPINPSDVNGMESPVTPDQLDDIQDESSQNNENYIDYSFRNEYKLEEHYEKHGIDMGFDDAESYENAASDVVNNPEALHKIEQEDGDDVYYVENTNEFVVVSPDGYIRTYFNPDKGIDYYNNQ